MTHIQKQLTETYENSGYSAALDFWKENSDRIDKLSKNEISFLKAIMSRYCLINNDSKNIHNFSSDKNIFNSNASSIKKRLLEKYEEEGYEKLLSFWKENSKSMMLFSEKEILALKNIISRFCLINKDEKLSEIILSGKTEKNPQNQEILEVLNKLGTLYSEGGSVTKNEYEAEKIFVMLAERGSSEEMYNLAEKYMKGDGIMKNIQKAIECYKKVAISGNKKASFKLGEIYMSGKYISRDKNEALKWYTSANKEKNYYSNTFSTMIIPDGITRIEESAFEGFENLVKVVIPESVKEIGSRAFCSCSSLKEVVISNNDIIVKYDAFKDCNSLPNDIKKVLYSNSNYVYIKDFYIGRYPVTQDLYENVMGENPSYFKGSRRPVETVSWYDAIKFCNELSKREGLQPCYVNDNCNFEANGYRLPTKSEWEYAAKSGKNYKYSGSDNLNEVAWYTKNSAGETHNVGQKLPNDFGLYDMSGNVREWCCDSPISDFFMKYDSGGGWNNHENNCSLSSISWCLANAKSNNIGFRLVRSANLLKRT